MTYEERVRSIAEEMARTTFSERHNNDGISFSDQHPDLQSYLIRRMDVAAHIAVKHMAEAYKLCWESGGEWADTTEAECRLKRYLLSYGLIPDKEDGSDA